MDVNSIALPPLDDQIYFLYYNLLSNASTQVGEGTAKSRVTT